MSISSWIIFFSEEKRGMSIFFQHGDSVNGSFSQSPEKHLIRTVASVSAVHAASLSMTLNNISSVIHMFDCKLIGFNTHLVKGASQSFNDAATHTRFISKHRLTQQFARAISSWKVRIWNDNKFNERLTSVSWNILTVDKKQTCLSCEMFSGLQPSIKIRKA